MVLLMKKAFTNLSYAATLAGEIGSTRTCFGAISSTDIGRLCSYSGTDWISVHAISNAALTCAAALV